MTPEAEDAPATAAKQPRCVAVVCSVTSDFKLPVFAVCLWHAAVAAAAVPEAAVYENGQALVAEDEVGTAWQGLVPTPAGYAGGAKEGCQL